MEEKDTEKEEAGKPEPNHSLPPRSCLKLRHHGEGGATSSFTNDIVLSIINCPAVSWKSGTLGGGWENSWFWSIHEFTGALSPSKFLHSVIVETKQNKKDSNTFIPIGGSDFVRPSAFQPPFVLEKQMRMNKSPGATGNSCRCHVDQFRSVNLVTSLSRTTVTTVY